MAEQACPHVDFNCVAEVNRLVGEEPRQGDIVAATGFQVDLTIACRDCGEPFVWVGPMAIGVSPGQPMVSVDGTELRAPLRPKSAPEDFGLNRPGFHVSVRGPEADHG